MRWHLDLERRSDGSFVYDGGEQYGGSALYDYWGTATYADIDPTASYVLTFALAKQQLHITGKDANPTHWLPNDKVTNAIWVGMFNQVCAGYDTNQLVAALGEYDPGVRWWAAATLGTKANTSFAMLTNLAHSTNVLLREAACQALGVMKNTSALPLLGQRLSDTNIWVRSKASKALQNFGSAASPQLTNMLNAFIANATDPHLIVWEDPIQIANGYLADELFNTLGSSTIHVNTNLLYRAVRTGLTQPDGMALNYLSSFLQNRLTWTHVQMVASNLVGAVAQRSPADRMFSDSIRYAGLHTLAKYLVEEGLPLALMVTEQAWDVNDFTCYTVFTDHYRGAARSVLPTLYTWRDYFTTYGDRGNAEWTSNKLANIAAAITAITNDASPPTLACFKKLTAVGANPAAIALPTTTIRLSAAVADLDAGLPAFGWSKLCGAGNVTFNPTGASTSSNCMASFDTPGSYVLQASAFDRSILDGNLWITYNLGFVGRDFQTYTNNYGAVYSNVTVTVGNTTNRAPLPQNQSVTTPLSTPLTIALAATDPNGDAVSYSVVAPPAHGLLSGAAPSLVYTPATDYTGLDSFTFRANDAKVDSSLATVTIDVGTPGNRRPVALHQSVTTPEDTPRAIALAGTDPDADPLTYTIASWPANGTLAGTPPNVTYLPATNYPGSNFNGADSFTFAASDGSLASAVATVSITVTPVNDPPVALAQSVRVSANTAKSIALAGVDPEGYALLYTATNNPGHGTLSGTAPNLTYLPATNYRGADSFTFQVLDSEGTASANATVSLSVITDPPVANSQSAEVPPNTGTVITLTGGESAGLPLTYTVVTQPANGVLSGTAPNVIYEPATNYTGADSFSFKVNNGVFDSTNLGTVSVVVVQWQGWTNSAGGNWSVGTSWAGGVSPTAGGGSHHLLVYNTNAYSGTSLDDLSGTFQLNRLIFGSRLPAVALGGNALSFSNLPATPPQVIQNGASALTISNALTLAASTTLGGTGAGPVTLVGVLSGAGTLTQTCRGILTLGGAGVNTYSGGTTVSGGTLVLNQNRFNLGSGPVTLADGTTFYTQNFEGNSSGGAITNTFNLLGGYATTFAGFGGSKDIWISGPVIGVGGLQLQGSGRSPGLMLSGAKKFSGGVKLSPANGGTPMVGIDHLRSLGAGTLRSELAATDVGSGNLRAYASLATAPGVTNTIDLAPGCRLVVDSQSYSLLLSGPITNAGSLVKIGSGTLTLAGTNTYSGTTTVTAGTLACTSPTALGSGALSIANGGTLNLNYAGTRQVASLTLGGTNQSNGTYGSSASPAFTRDTHLAGTGTLTVGPLPSLINSAAAGITTTTAALNATLACNGAGVRVVAFWHTANGGTNAALWTSSAAVGAWTNVTSTNLSFTATGLTPNTPYFFTFRAANALDSLWATNVQSFATLPAPPPPPLLPVSAIAVTGGVPTFTFGTVGGYKYRLAYKNALADSSWRPAIAPPHFPLPDGWSLTATGSPMSLSDTNTVDHPQRFYRLEAANP